MSSFDSIQALYILLFYFLWIIIVLIIWHFIWLKPYPLTLPNPESLHIISECNENLMISSLYKAVLFIYHAIFKRFDKSFWMFSCGFEAYCYILFLKRLLFMVFCYFLISFGFGIPYALLYSGADILNSFDLDDEIYKVYVQIIFLIIFSGLYFYTLFSMKRDIAESYNIFHRQRDDIHSLELKTLLLRGFDAKSTNDEIIKKIREMLEIDEKSRILSIFIPQTSDLFQLELKKKELLLDLNIIQTNANQGFLTKCLFNKQKLQNKLNNIDFTLHILKSKEFDTNSAVFFVYESKNPDNFDFSRGCSCLYRQPLYLKLSEGLSLGFIRNPGDISWKNINKTGKSSILKIFLLNLIGVLVILFFTTPISLLEVLDLETIFEEILNSASFLPGSFTSLLEKNLSPLLILAINLILLYIIDFLAYMKKSCKLSETQQEILTRSFIYLLFNNFIIPALSLTTVESIFAILSQNISFFDDIFETFYLNDTGSLFILLLLEAGVFTFSFYILRIDDLLISYFNRDLVNEKRKSRNNENLAYLRNEKDFFKYGYFYAISTVFVIIILVFSTTVPMISLTGVIYFFLKLICDAFEVISSHRKELDSDGRLISVVIRICCFGGIFFEILMMGYYGMNNLWCNMVILIGIIAGSCFVWYKIENIEVMKREEEWILEQDKGLEMKWRMSFQTPYLEN